MRDRPDGSSTADELGDDSTSSTAGDSTGSGWVFEAQAHYDPAESRDLTTVIIGAIAEAEGVPITEIKSPPLYEVVDIAGIDNALFGRPDVTGDGVDSVVQFRYNEYKVSVEANGWVTVSCRGDNNRVTEESP